MRSVVAPEHGPDNDRPAEADFAAFVVAQSNSLHRTAYLLTGDRIAPRMPCKPRCFGSIRPGPAATRGENPEGYAHQVVTRVVLSSARRRWWGELPTAELPEDTERGTGTPIQAVDERDALRRALLTLPVKQR